MKWWFGGLALAFFLLVFGERERGWVLCDWLLGTSFLLMMVDTACYERRRP